MYSSTYMGSHVAAAQNRSHQWCLTRPQTILKQLKKWRHCFLRPIRRDLTSSSSTTVHGDGRPEYLHVLQPPTLRFPFWRNGLYLLYLKFSALIRDDKHFARVQGSAINKPIIHIFSSAGRELATVKVARYSFSRSIPPKFERKLHRHKQGFVLDKEENWL